MAAPDKTLHNRRAVQVGRIVIGVLLCLLGAVWIAQGSGNLTGSPMTGHSFWTVAGAVVVVAGLGLIGWAYRVGKTLRADANSDRTPP